MLKPIDVVEFRKRGYFVPGRLLGESEADRMAGIYLDCIENYRSDHESHGIRKIRHTEGDEGNPEVLQLRCAHLMHPAFDNIVRDERLLDMVEQVIGSNIRLIICQGIYKAPHTGDEIMWHQDDYYFGVHKKSAVVSCWITFDDATIENGCMWVIPGAHRHMVEHVQTHAGFKMPDVDESDAVPIELKRGECMLHDGLMPHRTLRNRTDSHRRALAIHYMDATASMSQTREEEPLENTPVLRGHG